MKINHPLRTFAPIVLGGVLLTAFSSLRAQDPDLDVALPSPPSAVPVPAAAGDLLNPLESFIAKTRPTLSYSYADVDGLLSAPGVRSETSLQTISATFSAELVESLLIEYRPMWITYSNDAFDDTFSHSASIEAGLLLDVWSARLIHRYHRSATPLFESGRQTTVETHSTAASAQRRLGQKTTLDLRVLQNVRFVKEFSDHREWVSDNTIGYRLSSVVTAAAAFAYGYVDVDDSADMSYQQYRAQLRWQPAQTLQMDLRGGYESRELSGAVDRRTNTPIYGATVLYRPGETTSFRINGERRQSPSLFRHQLVRTTSWRSEVTQRLLGRLYLTLGWTYRTRDYRPTDLALATSREDRGRGYLASLGTTIFTRGTAAVFYQEHRNRSSNAGFNATSRRVGVELRYSF